jgi:hypothetical protein
LPRTRKGSSTMSTIARARAATPAPAAITNMTVVVAGSRVRVQGCC